MEADARLSDVSAAPLLLLAAANSCLRVCWAIKLLLTTDAWTGAMQFRNDESCTQANVNWLDAIPEHVLLVFSNGQL